MQKKIPELRFPEFNGDWETRKVNDILSRIAKPVDVHIDELYQEIGIRSHGKGIFYKEKTTGKQIGNKRVFWIVENAFVVNIVFAWEHAVSMTTEKEVGMIASHRFPMYLPVHNQASVDYLLHFFLTKKGKWLLELASPGGAGRNKTLGQQEFLKLSFSIPRIEEQHKIASFFTTIDTKISQLKRKNFLLEQYKKVVMKKIFSQEIKFRNDNGQEFPKWESKGFKEVFKTISSKKHQLKSSEYLPEGDYKVIDQGQRLIAGYSDNEGLLFSEIPVIIFGDHTTILKYVDFEFIVGADGTKLLKQQNFENLKFLYYFLCHHNVEPEGYKRHFSMLKNLLIELPCSKEQTLIASFLTSIDSKINLTQTQIEKAELWKKGLLQKLFV